MSRVNWVEEIAPIVLDALEKEPEERFPTVRSVWYYLWSALQKIPGTEQTYKQVDKLLVKLRQDRQVPFGRFDSKRGDNGCLGRLALNPAKWVEHRIDEVLKLSKDYELPKLFMQPFLLEIWIEKIGLIPTFERECRPWDAKVRSSEGFTPWEFMDRAVKDFEFFFEQRGSRKIKILYFGDQDPSGLSIYTNLIKELEFFKVDYEIKRVGVTIEQIREFKLPETPLDPATLRKIHNDTRYRNYVKKYGEVFCELDAFISLSYDQFKSILKTEIEKLVDKEKLKEREELNKTIREAIGKAVDSRKTQLEENKKQIIKSIEDSKKKREGRISS
nr:hypothetical protein [Candidatus Freyarchaeota archaeon]